MTARHLTIAAAAAALFAGAPARADALQDQLLAAARATRADLYSFRRTSTVEYTGAARKVSVHAYDPRAAPAQQWSLVSVDGRAPTAKEVQQFAKAKRGPAPSYAELAKWIGGPAIRSDGPAGYVTYRFSSLPKGTVKLGSHDASAAMQAEAVVNVKGRTPFVERVRLTATEGFRMMLVASVKTMTVTSRYRQLADGQVVPDGSSSDMSGSMMGKSGRMQAAVAYSDVQRVR